MRSADPCGYVSRTAAAVLLVAVTAAAVTYALWAAATSVAAGVIGNGNLDIVLVGTATWTETSPDVVPPHAFGMQADGETADHLATPGDSFTLTQQFQTVLDGDNLAARVTVRWDDPPVLDPAGQVTATYVVTTPDGVSSAPVPLGTAVTVPPAPDNLTAAEVALWAGAPWSLTVTLAYSGTDVLVTPVRRSGPGP